MFNYNPDALSEASLNTTMNKKSWDKIYNLTGGQPYGNMPILSSKDKISVINLANSKCWKMYTPEWTKIGLAMTDDYADDFSDEFMFEMELTLKYNMANTSWIKEKYFWLKMDETPVTIPIGGDEFQLGWLHWNGNHYGRLFGKNAASKWVQNIQFGRGESNYFLDDLLTQVRKVLNRGFN